MAISSLSDLNQFWSQLWSQGDTRRIELSFAGLLSAAMVGLIITVSNLSDVTDSIEQEVIALEPIAVFPDFASISNISLKKQQFFDYLENFVIAENIAITQTREQLNSFVKIANSGAEFSGPEKEWIYPLAENYRIEVGKNSEKEIVEELLMRVDVLPVSLALAQAANESAWGTSRFALEGNNIFGQWCFEEGCGIVPARRRAGDNHEVKSFDSIEGSIKAYFLNINSHPSYAYLRDLRSRMRERNLKLDPMSLAIGLGRYSERGDNYVDEVQTIIIQNDLRKRDALIPGLGRSTALNTNNTF